MTQLQIQQQLQLQIRRTRHQQKCYECHYYNQLLIVSVVVLLVVVSTMSNIPTINSFTILRPITTNHHHGLHIRQQNQQQQQPSSTTRKTCSTTTSSTSALYGIPKMFRWLTDQYPHVLNKQLTDVGLLQDIGGSTSTSGSTSGSTSTGKGGGVDNFYLDMNGIIHPCTHGNSKDTGEFVELDETIMFKRIFTYVDKLYKLVSPSKVLYLAIDGVAPRAKMNQQRSRRFRAAKDVELLQSSLVQQNLYTSTYLNSNTNTMTRTYSSNNNGNNNGVVSDNNNKKRFDSNCITPGTDFMYKLNIALQKWVDYKLVNDPYWIANAQQGCTIFINGPDIPGEGEHKVMDFIRYSKQIVIDYHKNQASGNAEDIPIEVTNNYWQPNNVHVLYGLDADLIMLGLVTHEEQFLLLREKMSVVMAGRNGGNKNSNGRGTTNNRNSYGNNNKKRDMLDYTKNDYEVLQLSLFRKMLGLQFRQFATPTKDESTSSIQQQSQSQSHTEQKDQQDEDFESTTSTSFGEEYSINRIIDDFVFMCMLVGNDFLPHIPHLEIDTGAISLMISTYSELLVEWQERNNSNKNNKKMYYLTNKASINPYRLEEFLYRLCHYYENDYFIKRGYDENDYGWQLSSVYSDSTSNRRNDDEPTTAELDPKLDWYGTYYSGQPTPSFIKHAINKKNNIINSEQQDEQHEDESIPDSLTSMPMKPSGNRSFRRQHPDNNSRSYRDYYYNYKLKWNVEDRTTTLIERRQHVYEYIKGLHWNLHYYHNGCSAWDWYFPYLYAPLGTDIVNIHEFYNYTSTNNKNNNKNNNKEFEYKTIDFTVGIPYPSLGQLLAVLPPQSAELLPKSLSELMISDNSPIKHYYPYDYTNDPNGKRQSWEALVLIPFIDTSILLDTVNHVLDNDQQIITKKLLQLQQQEQDKESEQILLPDRDSIVGLLTPSERKRNILGTVHTYTTSCTSLTSTPSTVTSTLPNAKSATTGTSATGSTILLEEQQQQTSSVSTKTTKSTKGTTKTTSTGKSTVRKSSSTSKKGGIATTTATSTATLPTTSTATTTTTKKIVKKKKKKIVDPE